MSTFEDFMLKQHSIDITNREEVETNGEKIRELRQAWNAGRDDLSYNQLRHYRDTINQIDDYFEYRYKQYTLKGIVGHVHFMLESLTGKLKESNERK